MQPDEPIVDAGSGTETGHWPVARVLVAEDDAELRQLLTTTLRKGGFDVLEAADGTALLDRVGDVLMHDHDLSRIDVIVSDIRMPGWSGLDVLAGLVHANCRVPVVLITGYADSGTRETAAKLGAKAFLQKPVDMDDLCTVVVEVLMGDWAEPVQRAGTEGGHDEN